MVIWSYTREFKKGIQTPVFRYYYVKDIFINKTKKRGEDYLIINPKAEFEGYLINNINYIIHWVHGIASYKQGNYKEALNYFEKINIDYFIEQLIFLIRSCHNIKGLAF